MSCTLHLKENYALCRLTSPHVTHDTPVLLFAPRRVILKAKRCHPEAQPKELLLVRTTTASLPTSPRPQQTNSGFVLESDSPCHVVQLQFAHVIPSWFRSWTPRLRTPRAAVDHGLRAAPDARSAASAYLPSASLTRFGYAKVWPSWKDVIPSARGVCANALQRLCRPSQPPTSQATHRRA